MFIVIMQQVAEATTGNIKEVLSLAQRLERVTT
jgi:hypothetical protein